MSFILINVELLLVFETSLNLLSLYLHPVCSSPSGPLNALHAALFFFNWILKICAHVSKTMKDVLKYINTTHFIIKYKFRYCMSILVLSYFKSLF